MKIGKHKSAPVKLTEKAHFEDLVALFQESQEATSPYGLTVLILEALVASLSVLHLVRCVSVESVMPMGSCNQMHHVSRRSLRLCSFVSKPTLRTD